MANVEFKQSKRGEWFWVLETDETANVRAWDNFVSRGVAERNFIEFCDHVEEARERFRAARGEQIHTQIPGENE